MANASKELSKHRQLNDYGRGTNGGKSVSRDVRPKGLNETKGVGGSTHVRDIHEPNKIERKR